ncbi:MAG: flagellar filament capping protein FliD [Planctomycetota bacterium]
MSSAGISFGGLSSGLDTKAIISALVAVERRPITAMQRTLDGYSRQKELFGDLSDLLDTLRDKANALKTTTDFLVMQAASSDEDVLTASATNSASAGSYQVEVVSLATAKIVAAGVDNRAEPMGTNTLLITRGSTTDAVDFGNGTYDGTIDGIAAAINAGDYGVTAEVVDTGQTTGRYQLILRADETGAAGDFSVALDSPGNSALNTLVSTLQTNVLSPAADAHIKFNGVDVYRSSNSVTDLIGGVTLQLKSQTAANTPVTVTVSPDASATADKVREFVDAYNAVVDFIQTQFAVDSKGEASSPLFGDATLRSIRSTLRSIVGSTVSTGNSAYSMFAQIGITSDTAGKLTFAQSAFEEALVADETAVASLFTDTANGIANRIYSQVDVYTDSVDGLIKARTDGLTTKSKNTQARIDQAERRLEAYQARLEQTYANLETLLSQLQSQGSSLGSFGNLQTR